MTENAKTTLVLLIATLLWGIWGVADKNAVTRVHPYTVHWMYSIPYVLLLPLWYWMSLKAAPEAAGRIDFPALLWALGASVASMLATVLLFFAMRSKPASLAVAMTSAYPLVTLALGILTHTEALDVRKLFGIILIIIGVIFIQF